MRETDDIERLFQESFEGFEATPPASVKTAIDREITAKKHNLWWLLALLFLLTTAVVTTLLISDPETKRHDKSTELAGTSNPSVSSHSGSDYRKRNGEFEGAGAKNTGTDSTQNNEDRYGNQARNDSKKQSITQQQPDQYTISKQQSVSPNHQPKIRKQNNKKPLKTTPVGKQGVTANPMSTSGDGILNPQDGTTSSTTLAGISEGNEESNPASEQSDKKDSLITGETAPKDSLIAKIPDSTGDESKVAPSNDKPKDSISKWMASIYFGPQFDIQHSKYDYKSLKANPSFRTSLEINRSLVAGYGLNTGVGYNSLREKYTVTTYSIDSIYVGIDSIPIYDQQNPDSIIGYTYYSVYNADSIPNNHTIDSKVSTIFIPIYISKHFAFNQNWGLLVNAGAIFRISSITSTSDSLPEPPPTQYKTGIMLSARLQGTYTMGSWMFSAGLNCGYYVKPPLGYYELDSPRYFFSPQVGIHYRF